MKNENIFVKPSRESILTFCKWLLIVFTAFISVYYSCNSYASGQTHHYHMYADWELGIPLIPQMIIVYFSYVLVFLVVLFVFKAPDAIKGLAGSMLVTIAVSGVIFVAFPGHLGYGRHENISDLQMMFSFLYTIDKPHNLFPSLHVAFAGLCVLAMMHQTESRRFHWILKAWFLLTCSSVILVHQHHFFDVVSGFALSLVVHKAVYMRIMEKPAEGKQKSLSRIEITD